MKQYGIVDIGSNTIVLIIYQIVHGIPQRIYHISTPSHLIDYVDEKRHMSKEGIRVATKVLQQYASIMDQYSLSGRYADITEPSRITNLPELVSSLETTGITIVPLTGEMEARYDFEGTRISLSQYTDGIAFDVGGGSTELIAFQNNIATTAMSFPLGCVRLSHLPLDTAECARQIAEARNNYPELQTSSHTLIGIGGTMRAVGLINQEINQNGHRVTLEQLTTMFTSIQNRDCNYLEAMDKVLKKSRIAVLLPGLHMILEICKAFQAQEIIISPTGIREGFLLAQIESETN